MPFQGEVVTSLGGDFPGVFLGVPLILLRAHRFFATVIAWNRAFSLPVFQRGIAFLNWLQLIFSLCQKWGPT